MNDGGTTALRTFLQRLLLASGLLAGTALTWGTAWVGFTRATQPTCGGSCLSKARLRVKAARDATAQ